MRPDAVLETATRKRGRPVGADSAGTRIRILDAARNVIVRRGYQAATFQAIAMEAGLTRPNRLLTGIICGAVDQAELPADTAVDAVTDMVQSLIWGLGFHAGFIDSSDGQ
jgi:hypothetical protein